MSRLNELTDKQKTFVNEYLIDLNATQAAIRAGYSAKTANVKAAQLLSKVSIQAEIQKKMAKREKRTEITQDRVLKELATIGFFQITDFMKVDKGQLVIKDTSDVDLENIPAISGIKATQFGLDVRFHDKVKALELIGEHLGMWSGNTGNADSLARLDEILSEVKNNATKPEAE